MSFTRSALTTRIRQRIALAFGNDLGSYAAANIDSVIDAAIAESVNDSVAEVVRGVLRESTEFQNAIRDAVKLT